MRIRKLGNLVDALNDRGYLRFIPDKAWIKYSYKKKVGKKLNLKDPQTFKCGIYIKNCSICGTLARLL